MISFGNVSALQAALPEARKDILNEGKLNVGGKEYKVDANTQQFVRSNPSNNAVAQFFEATGKLFREGNTDSVAKAMTKSVFDNALGQAERLKSSSSVEHGQMFFKDASLKTPVDVLNAFSRLDAQTIQSYGGELNQLADLAMSELLLDTEPAKSLNTQIGEGATKALAGKVVKAFGGGAMGVKNNPNTAMGLEVVFETEVKNLKAAQAHIEGLANKDLSSGVYADSLAEDKFNKTGTTNNLERAAAWIINASTSKGNDADNITALLKEYAANDKDLLNMDNLKELHARAVPNIERDYRGPATAGGALPSSIGGEGMLKQHIEGFLKENPVADKDLGKQLFAGVIGYHGFTDGNGRMGRMLYAIAELRNDSFTPLAMTAENNLHGIK
ncbi:VopS family T3SS effector adenosine monophosphate-protein transferase [Vibrio sp. IB15]|uniref:VopS family T3SS effector adenosine monophosphate-protein transferase n=1 Tax=Vibrio chagasii TaxID=170679 RepID=A0A7V7NQ08_9VIBR|nr:MULTISPECIES: VopS family T3SS effector adenosine monophosphate-protein transferase [Vibrio]KAB0470322.1 VopS family T3SS effector adenosine monophosphate-protein transferase [Vibrio chagasii]MBJ2147736.1 VopS family T3SS effector adenosine monophosphate-protein transferase [Vibrio sp. IB15]